MKNARVPADRRIMSSRFFGDVFSLESRPRLEPGAHDEQKLIQERDHRAFQLAHLRGPRHSGRVFESPQRSSTPIKYGENLKIVSSAAKKSPTNREITQSAALLR